VSEGDEVGPLIHTYTLYGTGLPTLFAPSPRLGSFGLHALTTAYTYREPTEGVPTFGLLLSGLAVAGLAASWRRRSACSPCCGGAAPSWRSGRR
jgi:hypothetical protein